MSWIFFTTFNFLVKIIHRTILKSEKGYGIIICYCIFIFNKIYWFIMYFYQILEILVHSQLLYCQEKCIQIMQATTQKPIKWSHFFTNGFSPSVYNFPHISVFHRVYVEQFSLPPPFSSSNARWISSLFCGSLFNLRVCFVYGMNFRFT